MKRGKRDTEDLLLDWHLGRLDAEDQAWMEEELERNQQLRTKSERLGKVLRPLDDWRVAPARANLAENVLAYIERSARTPAEPSRFRLRIGRRRASATKTGAGRFIFGPLREPAAVAACILLLVGVLLAGVSELRARSQKLLCASRLGSVFRGVSAYREAFAGSLPFAGSIPGASWLPGGTKNRPYASNSRHLYLIAKLNYGPKPEDFICPSSEEHEAMRAADFASYDDFASARNISYSTLNLAGTSPALNPTMPIAYISDTNPLFVGARFNESVDPDRTNSPAHRGRGQNVLTLDGSARWMRSPIYVSGPKRDNLWLIGNIRRYTGVEAPADDGDVQLVPGYPATDPVVRRALMH